MTTTPMPALQARNADLHGLVELLNQQRDVKYDVVVPSARLHMNTDAHLVVEGGAARITDHGVTEADAILAPTDVFDAGVSQRLSIPLAYVRRMRDEKPWLLADNVNAWLADQPGKQWLVRGFRVDDSDVPGIARAFLSDRYRPVDNLDVLLAALDGVREAGVDVNITQANLSERAMRVHIDAPEVRAMAPTLLRDYRSPFTREAGADLPIVSAGLALSNSETGGAAFQIVPRLTVLVCRNGMTVTKDAHRQVHLGGRLDEGRIEWSTDTWAAQADLVRAQCRDAVATFLSADYVEGAVAWIEGEAGREVDDAPAAVQRLAKVHGFTEGEQTTILDHFIKGGDTTSGGMMQAVTSTAQVVDDPDRAAALEDAALDVLVGV